jgi:hypothetical protein
MPIIVAIVVLVCLFFALRDLGRAVGILLGLLLMGTLLYGLFLLVASVLPYLFWGGLVLVLIVIGLRRR